MIKFFRKIRQKLISDSPPAGAGRAGKFSKYLLYAIGEIILVMVGILLALQVNEWNNERIRNETEQDIIQQLKADLSISQEQLVSVIERREESAAASALVCHAFWQDETPHDSIFTYMRKPMGTGTYSPILGTMKSLINSGNLTIIKSDKLKNLITSYVEKVESRLKDINRYEETYYRRGVVSIIEITPRITLAPKSQFLDLIAESNAPNFEPSGDDKFNAIPNVIKRVPFEPDLNALFRDHRVYSAYSGLLTAHKRGAERYRYILNHINDLLEELEQNSKK